LKNKLQNEIKIILCGLGVIGSLAAHMIIQKKGMRIVGAISRREKWAGKDLGALIGFGKNLDVIISPDASKVFSENHADIVLDATSRYFSEMYDNIADALRCGINVIAAGEEAAYPWTKSYDLAQRLDILAKQKNVTVLGTGTLPPFMANYLPISLTGLMSRVNKISIHRVVDATTVGETVWEEYGFGKKIDQRLKEKMKQGYLGGVTWREQTEMTARSLGWTIDDYTETTSAVISKSRRTANSGIVKPNTSCGLKQKSHATCQDSKTIDIDYAIIVKPDPEEDRLTAGHRIIIEGDQRVEVAISRHDAMSATAALMVNSIPNVIKAQPGIITALELPPSSCLP